MPTHYATTTAPGRSLPKLRKLLGPKFGYRVNTKAPNKEERDEALAQFPAALAERDACEKALREYRTALLNADQGYQRLMTSYKAAKERTDNLGGLSRSYKITAGVSNSMFFTIRAEGDTWTEIVEKLEKKNGA
jgi:hypothetical protein